jgi:hypothetical protein
MKKIKELIEVYGAVAIATWFVIFGLVWGGFALAITFGFEPDSVAGGTGIALAAYLATQATKPLRAVATLALTPLVARVFRRRPTQIAPAPVTEAGDAGVAAKEA